MRYFVIIIGLFITSFSFNAYASTAVTYLGVSCTMTRSGGVTRSVSTQPFNLFSYTSDIKTMIGDIKINCPKGTAINVTFETTFIDNKKLKIDPPHEYANFYKDASCTELWQPLESFNYNATKSGQVASNQIFCKTNNKALSPGINKKIIVMNIIINY